MSCRAHHGYDDRDVILGTNNLGRGSSRDRGGISSVWNCWMGRYPDRACFSAVT